MENFWKMTFVYLMDRVTSLAWKSDGHSLTGLVHLVFVFSKADLGLRNGMWLWINASTGCF